MTDSAAHVPEVRLLIAGEPQDGVDHAVVLDKYRLTPCGRLHIASHDQVRAAVEAARRAYVESTLTPYERGTILDRAAQIVERDSERFVEMLRTEGGFTLSDA